ncbi:MAG: CDP-alcohol phosphatidyltransferase family protein [Clostridia bacterium]|nr:CDP-alcohol phosphatidyltransferase family protein [Clostridia bacterium]
MNVKKQIPNILSVFRLFMIPVFVVYYFKYTVLPKTLISAGVFVLAWVTDALDGYLARRNNWITDVGKLLDPLADKLMQITAAVCFTIDNRIFLMFLIPLVLKELLMLIGAIIIMKNKKAAVQASWYGKVATILLFVCAFARIIVRGNAVFDTVIASVMLLTMLFALVMYYLKDFKGKYI